MKIFSWKYRLAFKVLPVSKRIARIAGTPDRYINQARHEWAKAGFPQSDPRKAG